MSALYLLLRRIVTGIIVAIFRPGATRAGVAVRDTRAGAASAAARTMGMPDSRALGSLTAARAGEEE